MRMLKAAAVAAICAAPGVAFAQGLTVGDVFGDADEISKGFMLVLVGVAIAAIIISARKIMAGPNLAGGSAFLSSMRLGAPLIGLLGAAYVLLNIFLAVANVDYPVTLKIAAPGIVESVFILALGLLAGVVAVIGNWIVEARIDRVVLKP